MDPTRFDHWTRRLADARSRRAVFRLVAGGAAAAFLGRPGPQGAAASDGCGDCAGCCDAAGTCQDGTAGAACGAGGVACTSCPLGGRCEAGACVCPDGTKACNGECLECCGDGDCAGGKTCQGGSCACPSGTKECGGICHDCPDNQELDPATCTCVCKPIHRCGSTRCCEVGQRCRPHNGSGYCWG